jgi:hypothetical protein
VKKRISSKKLLFACMAIAVAVPAIAQEFRFDFRKGHFEFDPVDRRGNEGKRAACATYAQIAVVQAEANRWYNCGYSGGRWDTDARAHFRWCRFVQRETKVRGGIERSTELQRCFDRLGDFDSDRWERRYINMAESRVYASGARWPQSI